MSFASTKLEFTNTETIKISSSIIRYSMNLKKTNEENHEKNYINNDPNKRLFFRTR